MNEFLIKLLKKTKLRTQLSTDLKYLGGTRPWSNYVRPESVSVTSFEGNFASGNLPGQITTPNVPQIEVDFIVTENSDFLVSENEDNIII